MKNALLLILIVALIGCQADDTPTTKTTETTPATDAEASVAISELNLNSFAPYSKGPNGPIRLAILFELDAKTEAEVDVPAEYKKITTALEEMFTGDFGLFTVPPFSDYRNKFSISFATTLSGEDQSYNPITEAQIAAGADHIKKNKALLQNAPTVNVAQRIYDASFEQAGITSDILDQTFFYLDPVGVSVSFHDIADVPETAITSTYPDYTKAEKDWIIKRNILRMEALFDTSPSTVRVLISNNMSGGYAFVPRDETRIPTVFMGYSSPFIEPTFPQTLARTFVHEMGHITGQFEDEYYPFETDTDLEKGISCNCVSEGVTLHNGTPFIPSTDIKLNPWLQEKLPFENSPDGQVEYDRIFGPVPNYNGELYEGCAGGRYKSYRTHNLSIMSYHSLFMDSATHAQGFGPVHRYYMENLFFKNY